MRLRMSWASYLERMLCWRRKSPGALLKWRMRVGEMRAAASADSGRSETCPDPTAASLPTQEVRLAPTLFGSDCPWTILIALPDRVTASDSPYLQLPLSKIRRFRKGGLHHAP